MAKWLFYVLLLSVVSTSYADCLNAYSNASYTLSHAKKSLESHNFDHQQYYAERALDALEKTRLLVGQCGCDASLNSIQNGIDNLRKSLDPKDWEMGRYFTKKAVADAQMLMTTLDSCTGGLQVPQQDPEMETAGIEEGPVGNEIKPSGELKAQLQLKRIAEITLVEFTQKCRELGEITGCGSVPAFAGNFLTRSDEELENETLEATRKFYMQQYMNLQNEALLVLKKCSSSKEKE